MSKIDARLFQDAQNRYDFATVLHRTEKRGKKRGEVSYGPISRDCQRTISTKEKDSKGNDKVKTKRDPERYNKKTERQIYRILRIPPEMQASTREGLSKEDAEQLYYWRVSEDAKQDRQRQQQHAREVNAEALRKAAKMKKQRDDALTTLRDQDVAKVVAKGLKEAIWRKSPEAVSKWFAAVEKTVGPISDDEKDAIMETIHENAFATLGADYKRTKRLQKIGPLMRDVAEMKGKPLSFDQEREIDEAEREEFEDKKREQLRRWKAPIKRPTLKN